MNLKFFLPVVLVVLGVFVIKIFVIVVVMIFLLPAMVVLNAVKLFVVM